MTRIRSLLIVVVLLAAAGLAAYLISHEPRTQIGVPLSRQDQSHAWYTSVRLTFKEFHPAGNQFSGAVEIEMSPGEGRPQPGQLQQGTKQLLLRFDRYEEPGSLIYQGGSDEPIAVGSRPAWGSLMGKGAFSWSGLPRLGPFFYPFDSYVLIVNPSLMQVSDASSYPSVPIDTLQTDFGNSNFIPTLENLDDHPPHDLYKITVERPALPRVLAYIVAVLLLAWLIYLICAAKPEEYAGNVVTLFVGVFSIRTSLLSGAPVFPGFIDYCALGVYLAAAAIVLVKWSFPGKVTKECGFCKSTIPSAATVCPHCTRMLDPAIGH